MRRLILAGTFVAAALFLNASAAQATVICTGCEYIGPAGTFIGTYNPVNGDTGTYQNTAVTNGTVIDDRWVFTIGPAGQGSLSADFTDGFGFTGFTGALYNAAASTCAAGIAPQGCTVATLGSLVAGDIDGSVDRVATGVINLAPGTYIFQLLGTAAGQGGTASYSGQIGTFQRVVPEPAALALFAVGLAFAARRLRKA